MDNDKVIDEILTEWAMRSPDGLAGGHDTPENMAVLDEILSETKVESKLVPDPNNPGEFLVKGHPRYFDGTSYSDILAGHVEPRDPAIVRRARETPFPGTAEDREREDLNIKYFYPLNRKWVTTDEHPYARPGTPFNDVKHNRGVVKKQASIADAGAAEANALVKSEWSVARIMDKKFNAPSAKKIYEALFKLEPAERVDFLKNGYDKLKTEAAIDFINSRFERYAKFIDALDAARSSGGKKKSGTDDDPDTIEDDEGGAGSKAGRGEFLLVLLIKGGKTAGSASGDIIVDDQRGAIEVKEITANGFRATKASFGGNGAGFYRLTYISAMTELINFCSQPMKSSDAKNKDSQRTFGDVLLHMAETAAAEEVPGEPNSSGLTELAASSKQTFWDRIGPKVRKQTIKFLKNPSLENINMSTAYGLEALGAYIRGLNAKEIRDIAVPNTVEFDLKKTTTTMKITAMPEKSQDVVTSPPTSAAPVPISLSVKPITSKDVEEEELVIPAAKRLKFFQFRESDENVYTPQNIAKEMFAAMQEGHYKGGIIFYHKNTGFYYEKDLRRLKHGDWYFYSYQQTGPFFVRDEKPF